MDYSKETFPPMKWITRNPEIGDSSLKEKSQSIKASNEESGESGQVIFYLPDNGRGNFDKLTAEEQAEYNRLIHKANGGGSK